MKLLKYKKNCFFWDIKFIRVCIGRVALKGSHLLTLDRRQTYTTFPFNTVNMVVFNMLHMFGHSVEMMLDDGE